MNARPVEGGETNLLIITESARALCCAHAALRASSFTSGVEHSQLGLTRRCSVTEFERLPHSLLQVYQVSSAGRDTFVPAPARFNGGCAGLGDPREHLHLPPHHLPLVG